MADNKLYSIALQNFPGSGKIHVEIYQIDGISNLEPKKEYVLNARGSVLKVELPAVSVCLVKLIKKWKKYKSSLKIITNSEAS